MMNSLSSFLWATRTLPMIDSPWNNFCYWCELHNSITTKKLAEAKVTANVHTYSVRLVGVACYQPWQCRNHSHQQTKVPLPRITAWTNYQHDFKDKRVMIALLMDSPPFSLYCPKVLCYDSSWGGSYMSRHFTFSWSFLKRFAIIKCHSGNL